MLDMVGLCSANLREYKRRFYRGALKDSSSNAMQDSLSSNWLSIGRRYVPKSAELSISPRSATCSMLASITASCAPHQFLFVTGAWLIIPTDCALYVQISISKNSFDVSPDGTDLGTWREFRNEASLAPFVSL